MNIADRIQKLRKEKNISQDQLSDDIGISRETIYKWESSQEIPDIHAIIVLSNYFDVTTDYILKGNNKEKVKKFAIVATGLNYIGFIIMVFDALTTWRISPIGMTGFMVIPKVMSIIFMILGTMVFYLGADDDGHESVENFLKINIFSYASIISLIVYFLILPELWRLILYVVIVLVTEAIIWKRKK